MQLLGRKTNHNLPATNHSAEWGFTLIEVMVSVAIFAILTSAAIALYSAIASTVKASRTQTILSTLASQNLEVVKNMPYSQVGSLSGNPHGTLVDFANAVTQTIEGKSFKVFYEVTYVDDPSDGTAVLGTDSAPNDYKQVKMTVRDITTNKDTYFVTTVSPKGLESGSGGSILSRVLDSYGQPVSGASIHIDYPTTSPTISLDRITDSSGYWLEVGLPVGVNAYRITASKAGYTTDRTYAASSTNPNPTKPDVTVATGTLSQVTFTIDLPAGLTIRTLDSLCAPVDGVNVNIRGSTLIGTSPNVYYFNQNFSSSGGGYVILSNIKADTYYPTLLTGQSWVVRGTSPVQQIAVQPSTTPTYTMILGTNSTANSLLVLVKDAATGASLEGAQVHLRKGGSVPQDYYLYSGGNVWNQYSWTSGSGQQTWASSSPNKYWVDNGSIDVNSAPTGVRLKKTGGNYALSGTMESSTFDTGTNLTNYTTLTWQPTSQSSNTLLRFQIATSSTNTATSTWTYRGPDGTTGTYYTASGASIWSGNDGGRYVRYKAFLSTTNTNRTPVLTSINVNFVTGCFTPGQGYFGDLTSGNNYDLDVSLAGYATETVASLNISGNQSIEVLMSP